MRAASCIVDRHHHSLAGQWKVANANADCIEYGVRNRRSCRTCYQYFFCPVPTLLFWRLTSGLYFDLIKGDREFGNALGSSFERHVGEILAAAVTAPSLRYIEQAKYGTRQNPRATCDWLLV